MSELNGFENHATWSISSFIENDEDAIEYFCSVIDAISSHNSLRYEIDDIETLSQLMRDELFVSYLGNITPQVRKLLESLLSQVNWFEVASNIMRLYVSRIKPEGCDE